MWSVRNPPWLAVWGAPTIEVIATAAQTTTFLNRPAATLFALRVPALAALVYLRGMRHSETSVTCLASRSPPWMSVRRATVKVCERWQPRSGCRESRDRGRTSTASHHSFTVGGGLVAAVSRPRGESLRYVTPALNGRLSHPMSTFRPCTSLPTQPQRCQGPGPGLRFCGAAVADHEVPVDTLPDDTPWAATGRHPLDR